MLIKTKVENKDVLEYYNDNKLNFRVYLENDENPKSGLILGEAIISNGLDIKLGLEIGTGKYAPASFSLLNSMSSLTMQGTEIYENDFLYLGTLLST